MKTPYFLIFFFKLLFLYKPQNISIYVYFQLCDYGIDLQFQIDGQLRIPLTKAINDIKDKTIEVIKIRFSEDKWKPFNLKTKQQRDKLVEEYVNYGFSNIESYNKG